MLNPIEKVTAILGDGLKEHYLLSRGGSPLLALPASAEGAQQTLGLYQPQRGLAKLVACGLRVAARSGLHRILLPKTESSASPIGNEQSLLPSGADKDTVGILFGSAQHRIFRAVVSYRLDGGWEVGKAAVDGAGAQMLEQEAVVMRAIGEQTNGIPPVLGLERAGEGCLLRMPYIQGRSLQRGDLAPISRLLISWLSDAAPQEFELFSEWHFIRTALGKQTRGAEFLSTLEGELHSPTIRHGDLARWNLLKMADGTVTVLDWEWGEPHGLPGIDLAHFLAQDFRLVDRLSDTEVVNETVKALKSSTWSKYLDTSGWKGRELELMIVCLAFKHGAGHQENSELLTSCLNQWAAKKSSSISE